MIHHISAEYLTVDRVREILENNIKIDLSEDAKKRIVRCREYLDNKMETQKEPIYGITTGFGSLCNISIDKDQLSQLQKNLVMSHACGTGERVPAEIVKLMLLLKIQSLSYGNSGVQLETVQRLVDFFNNDVLPVVFQQCIGRRKSRISGIRTPKLRSSGLFLPRVSALFYRSILYGN